MYELFVFLLKVAVVLFNIVFYLTLTQGDGDSNWVFPKIPWFDDRMNWLEKEHKPIYWIIACFFGSNCISVFNSPTYSCCVGL